ncbi:phospho-sugar mutase [Clostridium formicaceticum]|uniref:phosphoglucomutase (alpha-D-glucose-1,6-bisphosphate-dependent) n=1 Tax=Clostridium formicaceticum TaxID=1497 RepID=A0AAC9RKH8_9CLOT|nr:phospho-sugar mutase [Clostridium formicaceticum]AOY75629.1 phosphoglucomutase [Clostridium formicaceticum]ARE85940.1 Phosphoglucomutase [Clostridium formicaceticum]
MDLQTIKNYETWLFDPYFDDKTREELKEIMGKEKEIEDRFYRDLEFGTGGLRGVIGAGTNRINKYTIRKATQGLANYIKAQGEEAIDRGVVIAYDSRHMSKEFTEEAALVLAANDIKAYVFEDLRPTPELSFAVRYLKAIAGIVITASHNPPEYNGYKVYWEDGAQVATRLAEEITKEIQQIHDLYKVIPMNKEEAQRAKLFQYIGEEVDDAYIKSVKNQSLRGEMIRKVAKDFKIVFTPLHGTGNLPIRRVLKEIGFEKVLVVPDQALPDPNFSTVAYPNPEEEAAFQLAIGLAKQEDAHLIIGTDPDCDRVGAVVKNKEGKYSILTGNQVGALLVEYILSTLKEKQGIPANAVIVKTIVTSEMGAVIAKQHGVDVVNTLTGFKYIGEKIKEFEETGEKTFLFGYEESYGYLAGTYARDKDAVVASMLISEMAAFYYAKGMTLYEGLMALYKKYGYYLEDLKSITLKGKEGMEKIQNTLEIFRSNPPIEIGGYKVALVEDYLNQNKLPKSNVLKFILEDNAWVCLRPSGTEPKLKIYCGVAEDSLENCRKKVNALMNYIAEKI